MMTTLPSGLTCKFHLCKKYYLAQALSRASDTTSLRAYITEYRYEHGRRYNAHKPGSYLYGTNPFITLNPADTDIALQMTTYSLSNLT